ncbi:Putative HRDC domain, 3'-5' exonuclease domain, HRDC-like superfamily, ribonuclease H superfamily [Septoria linicola]|uniref:HRDC domain, 3'-5' exonuclease domain, HRDC-like superfamily, ribonuclease H superfamily n=1 Tax=Septoria linicola TaxID=215465 RepID=A0A9Q9B1U4_9PEZI|nr:Putative HRDC domain, 3'-5' exonuclease domain, HRDC-like superfamily, ribonuclease H superfamily [Septoria linicola]
MEDFGATEASIKSALTSTTRSAVLLANEDIQFHRSLDSAVGPALDQQNGRLLGLAERLIGAATANTEISRPPRLKDLESVEGNWKAVVDVVDSLLERADTALDEFTGAVKRLSPGVETPKNSKSSRSAPQRDQRIEKPQLLFQHVPTNNDVAPFKPLLESKPHAAVPLETEATVAEGESQPAYPHPYQHEIENYEYPARIYQQSEPIMYHPFDDTTATMVDTEEALADMLDELKQAKEIAIDLEHHDSRSYIGIVSLMQISTRHQDWIVDTLKPWRRKLQCLNEVFADPNIIKVLHGAFMDIMWLQRDLGLYIVGLFDTHHASRVLGYTGGSLAFLLKKFADVDAQKQYQMADWRVRPLPKELFDYARSDTHFLLYIFDNMRNELIQKSNFELPDQEGDKIYDVLQRSTEEALQKYEYPIYDTELGQGVGWYKLLSRTPAMLNKEQFSVFRAVHQWRDQVAREQDDSLHYVMPNHQIFSIARAMPPNRLALLGVATPTSQTVRLRADELLSVVIRAKEAGKDGPDMMDLLNQVEPQRPKKSTKDAVAPAPTQPAPMPSIASKPAAIATSSDVPIRSVTSSFWGPAFESSAWDQSRSAPAASGISLAVPLPPLTAEIFADPAEAEQVEAAREPTPEPQPTRQEEDDVFVLRDTSKKRKRGADPADGMAANSDEIAIAPELAIRAQEKAERKAAKRAAKKAAKADGTEDMSRDEMQNGDDEVAFDYASAPSILNPPRERLTAKERKSREKQVNPYAKSMDAPKGLPRSQKEKTGRSMTYKG